MKFLVDAHLPKSLVHFLREKGHDALHTSELPKGNDTTDAEVSRLSIAENRVVISKDADFYDRYTARREPYKLLHVKTGNISNSELIALFEKNLSVIVNELDVSSVVQINQHYIIKII